MTLKPKTLMLAVLALLLALVAASVLMVASLRVIDPPMWSWRLMRSLDPPDTYPERIRHQWVALDEISPWMQRAVVASEDQRFLQHRGIDWQALKAAWEYNKQGRRVRGGSTLSQQTAKNLFLWSARSYSRKALEVYFTFWMERLLGKARILEIYLNIVEFGPGIYGVEAASQYFFRTRAQALNAQRASQLAVVLPNPYIYRAAPASDYVKKRARWVRRQMRQMGSEWLQQLK